MAGLRTLSKRNSWANILFFDIDQVGFRLSTLINRVRDREQWERVLVGF